MIIFIKNHFSEKTASITKYKTSDFIGVYKERTDWKGLSAVDIVNELRKKSWSGK